MRPDVLERELRERLDALGPAPRAELLHVLTLPDFERDDRIGEFWSYPESRTFSELLIDCEEDRTLRAGARRDAGRSERAWAIGRTWSPRRRASRSVLRRHRLPRSGWCKGSVVAELASRAFKLHDG